MPSSNFPQILVLWTGYPAGANIVRSLRRAGFPVVGAHPQGAQGGRSARCPRPLRYPSPTAEPDRFLGAVARICRERRIAAIVPVDEDIVRLLAERGDEVPGPVVVGPDAHQYRTLCDKRALARTARALGLDVPATIEAGPDGPDGPWPALPSIVKPRTSRSEVAKPRMVATAAERDAYIEELVAGGHSAIVQERIAGPRWVVQSVRAPGVFEHVSLRVHEEWPRGAGLASIKRADPPPEGLAAAAQRLLDHVDYWGPSGISFIVRDGRLYPHDVNLRLGATTGASMHAGLDFPRRAVEAVLCLGGAPFAGPPHRRPYMRLDLELEALLDALARRREGGAPWSVLRRAAAVGLSPSGRLDPSPLNPFWVGPLAACAAHRAARAVSGRARAARAARDPAPLGAPSHAGGGAIGNDGPLGGPHIHGGKHGDRNHDARAHIRR